MRTTSILTLFALSFSVVALADAPSPQAQNKSVVLKFEDQFKNKANHDIVDELMVPTYQAHGIGPAPLDRAGMKQLGKAIVTAFPDVHVTIDSVVAEGDLVVTRCSVAGTHKGPFQGIPATGRAIRFTEMHMYRLAPPGRARQEPIALLQVLPSGVRDGAHRARMAIARDVMNRG